MTAEPRLENAPRRHRCAKVVVFRKRLVRAKVLEFFAGQPPCLVALEACGGAHYWARELGKLGHTVRLIPPAYVKPFVKRQKNDVADAERRGQHLGARGGVCAGPVGQQPDRAGGAVAAPVWTSGPNRARMPGRRQRRHADG